MPKELIASFEVLWQTAMEQAQNQLAAYKKSLEDEHEQMLQIQQDSEKNAADLKQKLDDIAIHLKNEIAEKQQFVTELAVVNDRLRKKDDALIAEKEHYEIHLKRAYEEKEHTTIHNHQLQNDIKVLQEKLAIQAEQHQKSLTQQSTLQEESEKRWINLIDQANQGTKEMSKKLETLWHDSEEQIKKLKDKLTEMQIGHHEKDTQLKVALSQIERLEETAKLLEIDNIKTKSTVMKLTKDMESKNMAWRSKKRQKNSRVTEK